MSKKPKLKRYPDWHEFPIEHIGYGHGAPACGLGVYTHDRKFSWPDMELVTEKELWNWQTWLAEQGYEIPVGYKSLKTPAPRTDDKKESGT